MFNDTNSIYYSVIYDEIYTYSCRRLSTALVRSRCIYMLCVCVLPRVSTKNISAIIMRWTVKVRCARGSALQGQRLRRRNGAPAKTDGRISSRMGSGGTTIYTMPQLSS